jgi:hypothetical protein
MLNRPWVCGYVDTRQPLPELLVKSVIVLWLFADDYERFGGHVPLPPPAWEWAHARAGTYVGFEFTSKRDLRAAWDVLEDQGAVMFTRLCEPQDLEAQAERKEIARWQDRR